MKRNGLFALYMVAILLQGCAASSMDKVTTFGEANSGSKTVEVTVDQPKLLKKQVHKVIIGTFKVGFLTHQRVVTAGSVSTASRNQNKPTVDAHLKGLTTPQMQRITNELHRQFVEELKDRGYSLVSPAALAREPSYVKLQNAGVTSPDEGVVLTIIPDGQINYVAPDGLKLIYFLGEKKATFALSTETIKRAQALAETTGAYVLAVNYLVNFVNVEGSGGRASKAAMRIGPGLSIAIGSMVSVYVDSKSFPANIKLSQPVYSQKKFAEIQKAPSQAVKSLGNTSHPEDYTLTIDEEKYAIAVKDIAIKVNQRFIARLAEDRQTIPTP